MQYRRAHSFIIFLRDGIDAFRHHAHSLFVKANSFRQLVLFLGVYVHEEIYPHFPQINIRAAAAAAAVVTSFAMVRCKVNGIRCGAAPRVQCERVPRI